MGEKTAIAWTDSTFNPWKGCTRRSPGCIRCYAETWDKRNLHHEGSHWGPGAPRRIASDAKWGEPLRWNRKAEKTGIRMRVFCASTADWCDEEAPVGARERLFELIRKTPMLDWQLLTKRSELIARCLPPDWGQGWPNVWLGVSVENKQHGLPRIDHLRGIPAVCRFLSVEPQLEPLDDINLEGIHWCISGGESGRKARPFHAEWALSIQQQCHERDVAFFIKQFGANPFIGGRELKLIELGKNGKDRRSTHGANWDCWPEELSALKERQFPELVSIERELAEAHQEHARIDQVAAGLAKLASGLAPDQAQAEMSLRTRLITNEGKLFHTRLEKAEILRAYYGLYSPLRLWAEFLRIVKLPRPTAYRLLNVLNNAQTGSSGKCLTLRQSASQDESSKKKTTSAKPKSKNKPTQAEPVSNQEPSNLIAMPTRVMTREDVLAAVMEMLSRWPDDGERDVVRRWLAGKLAKAA